MNNYIKGSLAALIVGIGILGFASLTNASASDWHFNLRNATDSADVPFDLQVGTNNRDRIIAVEGATLQPILYDFGENFIWSHENDEIQLVDLPESKIINLVPDLAGKANLSLLASATSSLQTNINNANSNITTLFTNIASSTVQRVRAQTDTSGVYTWTYPQAYATDTVPVIQLSVEDITTGNVWNDRIVYVSSTSTKIQLTKSTTITILGINVLGVAATPQSYIHITAMNP